MSDFASGNDDAATTESVTMSFDSALESALSTEAQVEDEAVEVDEPQGETTLEETETSEGDDAESEGPDPEEETESDGAEAADEDEDRYAVKIGGEEFEVTVSELVNGYQRQADYTRKTQALAEEREQLAPYVALAEQLSEDPARVIAAMAERFGVQLGAPKGAEPQDDGVQLDPNDPIERELLELRSFKEQMSSKLAEIETERQSTTEAQRQAAVLAEIDSIRAEYSDPDLDNGDLLEFAVKHEIGDLRMAYVAMKATLPPPAESPTIRKIEAKRNQPKVAGGAHRAGVVQGNPDDRMSLEDALAAALSNT